MKKFLQLTGLVTLMCLSFFYTEKAVEVVKEYDDIYQKIVEVEKKYSIDSIDSVIVDDTIVPGISGKRINIDLSYSKMKRYGKYNESLIVYDEIKPTISISDNKDKFIIGGNESKNFVSLIFLVRDKTDVQYILKILNDKNISSDFFVDGYWIEKNMELFNNIGSNHNIGNLSYNYDYSNSSFVWLDSIIKKKMKRDYAYCYTESKNKDVLNTCFKNNDYTVIPSIILKNNFLSNVKEELKSGSIISISITDDNKSELPILINYIISKGYKIQPLNEHLDE